MKLTGDEAMEAAINIGYRNGDHACPDAFHLAQEELRFSVKNQRR